MVNVASHAFKLQFTSMIMHKEILCIVGPIKSKVFDVYLEPLLKEILQLWYGISTYNIMKERECKHSPYGQA